MRRRPAGAAGLHDRLLRGTAALLPGRRHRDARGQRHRQRPGRWRAPPAAICRPPSSSRKGSRSPISSAIVDSMRAACEARGRRCSSRATPRSSTAARATSLHHDHRHRRRRAAAGALGRPRARRGPRDPVGHDRRSRHRDHVGPRELEFETALVSDTAPLHELVRDMLATGGDDPLPARPDAGRARDAR